MACDRYLELLSARLDGALTEEEEQDLRSHLAVCPDCRAVGAQLSALQGAFPELEEIPAPEGFAQGVMDRIRTEEPKKVTPLFKRPQVRALAGLAACLALVVGLYGASRPRYLDKTEKMDVTARGFIRDAQVEGEECPQMNASLVDPESTDAPQIAAYTAPSPTQADMSNGTAGLEKSAPEDGSGLKPVETGPKYSMEQGAELVLTLEQLPEGAEDLILSSEAASAVEIGRDGKVCYHCVTLEELAQVEKMAQDQGISASLSSGTEASGRYVIIVLNTGE